MRGAEGLPARVFVRQSRGDGKLAVPEACMVSADVSHIDERVEPRPHDARMDPESAGDVPLIVV